MYRNAPTRRAALVTTLLCGLSAAALLQPTAALAAGTQGSGRVASESRTVGDFQAIALSGAMDLVVRQGTPPSLQVQADDNLLPLLETVVEPGRHGATLQVRWKAGTYNMKQRSKVRVTAVVPQLSALSAAGAGDLKVESFKTPSLQLALSGTGEVRLDDLSADELGVRISGSGSVAGKGAAAKVKINIAGSGDVRLLDLRADDVTVSIAGSGDAAVNAHKTLQVSIAGSGDVVYTGDAEVKRSVAGSGSVRKK